MHNQSITIYCIASSYQLTAEMEWTSRPEDLPVNLIFHRHSIRTTLWIFSLVQSLIDGSASTGDFMGFRSGKDLNPKTHFLYLYRIVNKERVFFVISLLLIHHQTICSRDTDSRELFQKWKSQRPIDCRRRCNWNRRVFELGLRWRLPNRPSLDLCV